MVSLLSHLLIFARFVTLIIFTVSFITKIRSLHTFRQTIESFQLLPRAFSYAAAILFITGEFTVALLLLVGGKWQPIAFSLALVLLLIFIFALKSTLHRKLSISCKCFGKTSKQVSVYTIRRNLLFFCCALCGITTDVALGENEISLPFTTLLPTFILVCVFFITLMNFENFTQIFWKPKRS